MSDNRRVYRTNSLGWEVADYAGFFLAVLLIFSGTLAGSLLFGVISLGELARTVAGVGVLALLTLILGFVLVTICVE